VSFSFILQIPLLDDKTTTIGSWYNAILFTKKINIVSLLIASMHSYAFHLFVMNTFITIYFKHIKPRTNLRSYIFRNYSDFGIYTYFN